MDVPDIGQARDGVRNGSAVDPESFALGDVVVPRGAPDRLGVVAGLRGEGDERRYVVLSDGRRETFRAVQLRSALGRRAEPRAVAPRELRARLTAHDLTRPARGGSYAAHEDPAPAPFAARAIAKLLRAERPRLLLADDMGLAGGLALGLILRELRARGPLGSIAIVCPKDAAAEERWSRALRPFDETFTTLDEAALRRGLYELDERAAWPAEFARAVLSMSLFHEATLFGESSLDQRRRVGLATLQTPPRFDLLIVDEAHEAAAEDRYVRHAIAILSANARAVVFRSAAPLESGNATLASLLELLAPDAVLARASSEDDSDLDLSSALAPPFALSRTRRASLGNFPVRLPRTIAIDYTPAQLRVQRALNDLRERVHKHGPHSASMSFLIAGLMRQGASCMHGLAPHIDDLLTGRVSCVEAAELDADFSRPPQSELERLRYEGGELLTHARALPVDDPKLDRLLEVIAQRRRTPNGKLVIFSAFRQTRAYLLRRLRAGGLRCAVLEGHLEDAARAEVQRAFARAAGAPNALDVLLASESGPLGLDLRASDALLNYDVPWSPVRLEGRIGCLDRSGQPAAALELYTLLTPETLDADVLAAWHELGLLERFTGSDAALLAETARRVRDVLYAAPPADERRARLLEIAREAKQQLVSSEARERDDAALFARLLGEDAADETNASVREAAGADWSGPAELANLVEVFLRLRFGQEHEIVTGAGAIRRLELKRAERSALLRELRGPVAPRGAVERTWEAWLRGTSDSLELAFHAEAAHAERPYCGVAHPLVRQAAHALAACNEPVVAAPGSVDAVYVGTPPGRTRFALYQWEFAGSNSDARFVSIADPSARGNPTIAPLAFDPKNVDEVPDGSASIPEVERQRLASWHDRELQRCSEQHEAATAQLVEARRRRLDALHERRCALARGRLERAADEKTRKLIASELVQAELAYRNRQAELTAAQAGASVHARLIGYGFSDAPA